MNLLALTILFPLAGSVALSFFPRMSDRAAATIGAGSIGLSALVSAMIIYGFVASGEAYGQTLWTWVSVGDFTPAFALYLDGLSATMLGVITGVGFLIHLFAGWYMKHDLDGGPGMGRFFAYMNLFIVAMLLLVLGDNLLLLYLGWEGVGLCSYLLIGYYYETPANAWAAFKAFIITRIGDVFLAIGLFLLYVVFGTLNIQAILHAAPSVMTQGSALANIAALMVLLGACGKSAQLPLQTWLADAMAGPTPVSALIHAATMVTAGVYLIARTYGLFLLAPIVRGRKGEYRREFAELQKKGFTRIRVDGEMYDIEDAPTLDKNFKHDIEVVVDRIVVRPDLGNRVADSLETALALTDGLAIAENADDGGRVLRAGGAAERDRQQGEEEGAGHRGRGESCPEDTPSLTSPSRRLRAARGR